MARITNVLLAAAILAAPACDGDEPRARRVLLVGWDGATFDLIDPLVDEGALPHLAALMESGRTAALESTRIPISSAAWPTISTGRSPGEHGVYSFFAPEAGSYDARLVSAMDVEAPPLWRILSARGRRVNVWGVPITYPPEPVDGTLVGGMLSPFEGDYAWPEGLAERLRGDGFIPDLGIWRQDQLADMATVEAQLAIKERELLDLARRTDWSFSMFTFKSLDVLCHRPTLRLDGPEIRWLLIRLDEILGRLVEAAGEDTVVMVVSDHGFARYETVLDLHRWLLDAGHSVPRSDAVLGERASGNLAERRSAERAARLGQLDLGRSAAWAGACEGPFGSIRLNVEGRDPLGCLDADTGELAARVESITRDLLALEFPDGERVVRAVHRGDELYPGPHAGWTAGAAVPDLIVELREDVQCVAGGFGRALSRRAPFPDHALDGILVMGGADVVHEDARGRLTLVDIAPMVLHALDEAVPSGMSGRAQPGFLRRNAEVRRIDDADDESLVPTKTAFGGRERAATGADVTSRVQGLGYGR